ncbi:MAG: HAMP domain-containing histidine kinase [Elusimicrobia bacterium]|nr:HAMP domain-containing histidine kinase [Elusimicrobiota bacterium]
MRLSYGLALVFALFGAVVAGGLDAWQARTARREAYAQAERLSAVTLEAVRALVQTEARQGRFGELGRDFEALVRQAGIATIVVRDRRGRRLVGRSDDPGLIDREPRPGRPLSAVDDGIYDAEIEANLGPRGRGRVQVGFRTAPLERRLARIRVEAVRLGATAFLALAAAAWLIGLFAGERIERVVSRLEAMAADPGRFRPLPADAGGGEIARLTAAFNRLGAELKAETAARRRLEAEREELSAMLVHDLKTPLTVIRSGVSLLADAARRPDGAREHARTFELLESSTARLQRMVEDVLQLAKLESAAALARRERADLAALARACVKDFALVAAGRRQALDLDVAGAPPVLGDPALLRRVMDNLVHNAVEHTPAGGRIALRVSSQDGAALVEVSDSGPGVPEEARAELFRKFFQRDLKRHVGNVGLGLALCEKVVRRHGGTIGVGDAEPRGARFFFTLPAAPALEPGAETAPEGGGPPASAVP